MDTADILLSTIEYAINKKLTNAELDRTILCTVTEVNGDVVTLSYGGAKYTVRMKNNFGIKVFDKVHLKFPSGSALDKYIEEDVLGVGGEGSGGGDVNSVNGKTGNVVIGIDDIEGLRTALSSASSNGRNQITLSRTDPNKDFVGAIWYEIIK